ncbi:MAG: hypothetical protein JRI72_01650 [Deltaproteobacteria bacterium]|nr:hypothetical protein [Deltaproteobacteria bacterium]
MLRQAYFCGWGLSRDNALTSGGRVEERFSLGALCPSGIIKGISPRLNKKSKTFNWAGRASLRLKAKARGAMWDLGLRIADLAKTKGRGPQ